MTWFENLMEGIERNLLTKNRDRFTQNLSVFRRDINDSLKGKILMLFTKKWKNKFIDHNVTNFD